VKHAAPEGVAVTAPDGVEVAAAAAHPSSDREAQQRARQQRLQRRAHSQKQDEEAVSIFLFLVFFMLAAQMLLFAWKKQHAKSYNAVTLLGLWLFPIIISAQMLFVKMILCCAQQPTPPPPPSPPSGSAPTPCACLWFRPVLLFDCLPSSLPYLDARIARSR